MLIRQNNELFQMPMIAHLLKTDQLKPFLIIAGETGRTRCKNGIQRSKTEAKRSYSIEGWRFVGGNIRSCLIDNGLYASFSTKLTGIYEKTTE